HAAWLRAAGVHGGERVGVWTAPGMETPQTLIANALAGVVSVPMHPNLGRRELEHILSDAAPRLVIGPRSAWPGPEVRGQVPWADTSEVGDMGCDPAHTLE